MSTDLVVPVDRSSRVPVWQQVADAVRSRVDDGTLDPGSRLPSTRALAATLGTSRIVVATAYEQLHAEGYLTTRHGAGTYVADVSRAPRPAPRQAPTVPRATGLAQAFGLAVKAPSPVGERHWRRALSAAARSGPVAGGDPAGSAWTRAAVAAHLRRSRGLRVGADEVLLTAGTGAALTQLATALLQGGPVAVEDPGHRGGRQALAAGGATCHPVPVDRDGLLVDRVPDGVSAVLCTPSHQYPLGGHLRLARRRALLEGAGRQGFWVVEDDYDSEFRYDLAPLPALASLDPSRVIYLGTTSQVLGHGTGVGWLVGPADVVRALAHAAPAHVRAHPLVAEAFGRFLAAGEHDREVRRARRRHAASRAVLVQVLTAAGLTVRGEAAGLHLVVDLPTGWTSAAAVNVMADAGIAVWPLDRYGRVERPALVLGYGSAGSEELLRASRTLVAVLTG